MTHLDVEHSPLDLRLVPSAVAAWAGAAAGILFGWKPAICTGLCLLGIAGVVVFARPVKGVVAACLVGAGFAFAIGVREYAVQTHPLHDAPPGRYVTAVAVIGDDPRPVSSPGPPRVLVPAELDSVASGVDSFAVGGAVLVSAPARGWSDLLPGQRVEFRAAVERPLRRDLTVALLRATGPPADVGPPSALQRIAGHIRDRFADAAATALPGDGGALLPALVVGDTSRISQQVRDDFRTAGLTHLLAVSGANVAILLGAVLLLLRGLAVGPVVSAVVAAIVLALFVVLARPSPSVLRAAVMGSIGLLGMVTSRRKQSVPALAAAVLVLIAIVPALAVDVGFALSVCATAGLILLAPTWADRLRAAGWPRAPAEILATAGAAGAVTAPLIAAISGTVSLVSVAANVVACVVVAPITVVGAAAAVLAPLWQPGAVFVAGLCRPMLWWLVHVAEQAASLPYGTVGVPDGFGGGAIVFATIAAVVAIGWWRATRPTRRNPVRPSNRERFDPTDPTAPRTGRRGTARRAGSAQRDRGGPRPRRRGG